MAKKDSFTLVCRDYEGNRGFIHKSMSISAFEKNKNNLLKDKCDKHWIKYNHADLEEKLSVAEIIDEYDKIEHCLLVLGDDVSIDLGVCIEEVWLPEGRWAMGYVVKNHIKR